MPGMSLRTLKTIGLSATVLACFCAGTAGASEIGILPPDLDYKKICVREKLPQKDDFDWTRKTPATSGLSPKVLLTLAKLYYEGSGETPPDHKRASEIVDYLIARNDGTSNKALLIKYDMLLKGRWFPQNTNMAKDILDKLIQGNDITAHVRYGDLYLEEENYAKAAEHYRKAFAGGEPTAAIRLAYLYHDRKIPATDEEIKASILHAQDAALQYLVKGNCHALTLFGYMYRRLNDLPKAEYYSAKWFEKAALLDEIAPKLQLAEIIQRGFVVENDENRVIQLWKEAAALGSDQAMFLLGEYAIVNYKTDSDLQNAQEWLEKSALRRNVKAMELLAGLYDGRYPSIENPERQRYWLEQAIEHDEAKDKTVMQLAEIYEADETVPPSKVFDLYQLAAAKGNIKAYVKLGDAYRYGLGVEAQPVRALRYYRRAASNGESAAIRALKQAYECRIGVPYNEEKIKFWTDQLDYYKDVSFLDLVNGFLHSPSNDESVRKKIEDSLKFIAISREDPEAMVLMGFYFDKIGNAEKAREWLDRALAADRKSGENYTAHTILGEAYLLGTLLKRDVEKGLGLLVEAAKAGSAGAHNVLGEWFGDEGDLEKAEEHFMFAAENGKVSAYVKLAKIMIERGAPSRAVSYLEKAALRHDIGAMLKLAEGYDKDGWTGTPDPEKSRYWFDRILKSYPCSPEDILAVSGAYLEGRFGVPPDEEEAGKWLDRLGDIEPESEDDRLTVATAILASGLARDEKRRKYALDILEKMGTSGNDKAIRALGGAYLRQDSPAYDAEKAIFWLEKSAGQGDVSSMMALSSLYLSGHGGVPYSIEQAAAWLQKAADAGDQEAARRLESMKPAPQ